MKEKAIERKMGRDRKRKRKKEKKGLERKGEWKREKEGEREREKERERDMERLAMNDLLSSYEYQRPHAIHENLNDDEDRGKWSWE